MPIRLWQKTTTFINWWTCLWRYIKPNCAPIEKRELGTPLFTSQSSNEVYTWFCLHVLTPYSFSKIRKTFWPHALCFCFTILIVFKNKVGKQWDPRWTILRKNEAGQQNYKRYETQQQLILANINNTHLASVASRVNICVCNVNINQSSF